MSFRPFQPFRAFGGGSVQSGFDPLTLSPALWLSDTGTDPSVWADLSGNGRHATQANASQQPAIITGGLNGLQVRRSDGVDDGMVGALANFPAMSVFVVFKPDLSVVNANSRIFTQQGPADGADYTQVGNYIPIYRHGTSNDWGSYADGEVGKSAMVSGEAEVATSIHTGDLISNYRNGLAATTAIKTLGANGAVYKLMLGFGGDSTKCDMAEVIVFPTALSDPDRVAVETYLNEKWAIY